MMCDLVGIISAVAMAALTLYDSLVGSGTEICVAMNDGYDNDELTTSPRHQEFLNAPL